MKGYFLNDISLFHKGKNINRIFLPLDIFIKKKNVFVDYCRSKLALIYTYSEVRQIIYHCLSYKIGPEIKNLNFLSDDEIKDIWFHEKFFYINRLADKINNHFSEEILDVIERRIFYKDQIYYYDVKFFYKHQTCILTDLNSVKEITSNDLLKYKKYNDFYYLEN